MTFTPHPYQRRAAQHLLDQPYAALWMEMGLGKTPTALMGLGKTPTALLAIQTLLDRLEVQRVLIVAPKRVALSTWPEEVRKWGFRVRLQVLTGSPAQRERQLAADADAWVINYELIPWLVEHYGNGKRWPFDMLVLDEASKVKHHATNRVKALRKVRKHIARVVELTGTPAPNGLIDLWAQLILLDQGARLFPTLTRYRERWFEADYLGYHYSPREGAEAEIHQRLADICLTLRAEDYLSLPGVNPVTLPVQLPDNAARLYQTLEREMLIELEQTEVTAWNAAALTNKCRQLANGALYCDDAEGWALVHNAKVDALKDLVDEAQGEPVLVAYAYQSDRDRLLQAFPHAQTIDDGRAIDRWNKGQVPMLIAHPASAGHGLNLQYGGRLICWFGLDWSLELYQQFNARLHRQGQTKPVFIYHLVAQDTVDVLVLERLQTKRAIQDILLDALKLKEAA